ncbi:HAD family hydrolase [Microbulbifer hainanensis]|uniref:HAD family hydrolase n=1 Tax=Microbulbifer hainanensis TaxID=2735675 RepID=UPI001866FF67|nr:HAD family phosphatase [Microbulbifer hainanensis]
MKSEWGTCRNMDQQIDLILFDLGGVLVDLRPTPLPEAWLPDGQTFDSIDWFRSDTALQFECGSLSPEAFAGALQCELELDVAVPDIIAEFTRWPIGLRAGARELLTRLRRDCSLAALTNTNALHWPRLIHEFRLPDYFSQIFASHLLHLAKPDPRIFHHVMDALSVAPEHILFFDDNPENVATAATLGIHSCRVNSIDQIRCKLRDFAFPAGH